MEGEQLGGTGSPWSVALPYERDIRPPNQGHLMPVHSELPPPKTWEDFEELCADLFAAEWNDPHLVRHGRAGQEQSGVGHLR